jgi:hypothetical protein
VIICYKLIYCYLLANIFVGAAKKNTKHLKIRVKTPTRILGKHETEVLLTAQRNSRPFHGGKTAGVVVHHLVITAVVITKYIYKFQMDSHKRINCKLLLLTEHMELGTEDPHTCGT